MDEHHGNSVTILSKEHIVLKIKYMYVFSVPNWSAVESQHSYTSTATEVCIITVQLYVSYASDINIM